MLPILASWSPETLPEWVGTTAAFGSLGIVLMLLAFVLFDKLILSGFKLGEEIKKGNMAAAVLVGCFALGMAFIIGKAIGM